MSTRAPAGFFAGLFDLSFTNFISLKFVSFIYGLLAALTVLAGVVYLLAGIYALTQGELWGLLAFVAVPAVTLFLLVVIRLWLESVALFFRIGENTSAIAKAVVERPSSTYGL